MQHTQRTHPRLDALLSRLQGARNVGDKWQAQCPAHEDRTPSLSVSIGDKGGILLKCFAGCKTEDVLAAVDLTMADLAPPSNGTASNGTASYGKPRIVATYDYRDASGHLVYQAVRFEPKEFKQRRPKAGGQDCWLWNLKGVTRVPYRLPELRAANPATVVYIVEGEKDVDRLSKLGFVATTNVGGALKWRPEYSAELRGRSVAILPDNDDAGNQHAQQVARALHGVAAAVRIVQLPGLPLKGDVSDWLNAGGTPQQLVELTAAAPEWIPGSGKQRAVCVRDVEVQPLEWLWPGVIPLGCLTLFTGAGGHGKSTLSLWLAAQISQGRSWPIIDAPGTAGDVLLLSSEDRLAVTIKPRLLAAGVDESRVHALPGLLSLERELSLIESELSRLPETRLVIIDPLSAYMGNSDGHKCNDVRRVLAPLMELADKLNIAIVAIHHFSKSQSPSARDRVAGSHAYTDAVRSAWVVVPDPDKPADRRLLLPYKSNLVAIDKAKGMAFRIDQDDAHDVGRIAFEGFVEISADEALAAMLPEQRQSREERDEAKEWLVEALADGGMLSDQLLALGKKNGHTERTLKRAKKELPIKSLKRGKVWYWQLEGTEKLPLFDGLEESKGATVFQGCHVAPLENSGTLESERGTK